MTAAQFREECCVDGIQAPDDVPKLSYNKGCRLMDVGLAREGTETKGRASVSVPSLRRATRAFGKQDLRTQEIERSLDDDIRGSDLYSVRENYMLMMAVAVAKTVREGGSLRVGKLWDPEGRSRKGGAQRFSCGMILSLGMAMTGRGLCSRACSPERMASVDTMPAMWIGTRRSGWTLREGA
ncbi:uncharacterized protein GGS25DRAFT_524606 [Hypoxylon fragiforme]|uniref:uncharacterized protein n=1 Tax=Hypoxylon fragiforme TaxID=63214 RepID=UPI0020C70542|nr:uncharacterized protein GGS25DRAFT_524606 [Hypoxylon fragiforme]KAI2605099.1 hypothetical protein GGS25DRAFT_524606 [Hypoxylon fragiforme]